MPCSPDYATHISTPVRGDGSLSSKGIDIVIVACTCGDEECTWQFEVRSPAHFPKEAR